MRVCWPTRIPTLEEPGVDKRLKGVAPTGQCPRSASHWVPCKNSMPVAPQWNHLDITARAPRLAVR